MVQNQSFAFIYARDRPVKRNSSYGLLSYYVKWDELWDTWHLCILKTSPHVGRKGGHGVKSTLPACPPVPFCTRRRTRNVCGGGVPWTWLSRVIYGPLVHYRKCGSQLEEEVREGRNKAHAVHSLRYADQSGDDDDLEGKEGHEAINKLLWMWKKKGTRWFPWHTGKRCVLPNSHPILQSFFRLLLRIPP